MKKKPDCLAVGLSPALQKTIIFKHLLVGEVNRSEKYFLDASGKCVNVCRVLTQAGLETACLTVAGKENREEFETLCRRDSLNVSLIETAGRVRTCTTLVDKAEKRFTELVVNEPEPVTEKEEQSFRQSFAALMEEDYKCLIVSGSRIEGFSPGIIPSMVRTAKERGMLVVADFRGEDLKNSFISETVRPDYIKINEEEFLGTFPDCGDLQKGLMDISSQYGCSFIISRGAESTLAAGDGEIMEIESKMIEPLNPIGCGDSMTAGLAQGILEGLSLKESVEKGRDYATLNALNIHPGWILES